MAKSTTHRYSPHEVHIVGRDDDDTEHFLFQERAKLDPTPEEIEAIKGSVSVILVARLSGYDYPVVVAGRQRTIAARAAGEEFIEAKIVKGSPTELVGLMVQENALQKAMTPIDKAKDAKKLIDLHLADGMTKKEAIEATATTFGQSKQSIKDYLTVLGFDPKVHEAIEKGRISAYEAMTRLRKVDPDEQVEVLAKALEEKAAPKTRADGRPAPERKRNTDKQYLKFMANDEQSPLMQNDDGEENDDKDSPDQIALLILELCHGLATKAEVFRRVPNFEKAYRRAKRALDGGDE